MTLDLRADQNIELLALDAIDLGELGGSVGSPL